MASLDEMLHEIRRVEESRVALTDKKINSIYRSLYKDLSAFLADEYIKYADKEGKLFLANLDSKNKRAKFLEEIVTRVDSISPEIKEQTINLVNKTYEKSFSGIAKAVKNADDTKDLISSTKTLVRPEVLKKAVNNNIDKLTLNAVLEKHRAEIVVNIQQALTVGLMNGDRYETMAKRVKEVLVGNGQTKGAHGKAMNIVRTESHRNIESGLMDGAKETAKIIEKNGDLIYAATWRTMKDERVRPQQRHRKKGKWVTTMSKNGANHMKMDGVTIKVGEKFQLEPTVFAECPGESGTARHDCNCRCFVQYRLMTIAEFAEATGKDKDYLIFKSKEQEKQIAEILGAKQTDIKLANIPNESKMIVKEALEESINIFPILKGHITSIKYDNGLTSIARSKSLIGEILVSSSFDDFEALSKKYAHFVKTGYAPKGTSVKSIVTHEIGHQLDGVLSLKGVYGGSVTKASVTRTSERVQKEVLQRLGYNKDMEDAVRSIYMNQGYSAEDVENFVLKEKKKFITTHISEYAAENHREFFAECYSEYMTSENPREAATIFGEILERIVGELK